MTPEETREYNKRYREANKEAIAAQRKAYREANKEAIAARKKKYYVANREAELARVRVHYEANKEARAAYNRAYYEANKEAVKAQVKNYREANKEAIKAKHMEYYAKNRGNVKSAREARKLAAIARMGGCCADCKQVYPSSVYDFHHIDPTEKEHKPSKLFAQKDQAKIDAELAKCVLLCSNCHRLRHYTD